MSCGIKEIKFKLSSESIDDHFIQMLSDRRGEIVEMLRKSNGNSIVRYRDGKLIIEFKRIKNRFKELFKF